jgi:hypothetical protein
MERWRSKFDQTPMYREVLASNILSKGASHQQRQLGIDNTWRMLRGNVLVNLMVKRHFPL